MVSYEIKQRLRMQFQMLLGMISKIKIVRHIWVNFNKLTLTCTLRNHSIKNVLTKVNFF